MPYRNLLNQKTYLVGLLHTKYGDRNQDDHHSRKLQPFMHSQS
ncbi:hypothetical protein [Rossellomorea aquimaris]|nr:hypothetical protein [Rossellomorea aquimaris]